MKQTVDFSKVKITLIDGTVQELDLSKDLAQVIFQNTESIAEHTFSVELFKNPIVELTDENKTIIEKYTSKFFKAFVQIAINDLIK